MPVHLLVTPLPLVPAPKRLRPPDLLQALPAPQVEREPRAASQIGILLAVCIGVRRPPANMPVLLRTGRRLGHAPRPKQWRGVACPLRGRAAFGTSRQHGAHLHEQYSRFREEEEDALPIPAALRVLPTGGRSPAPALAPANHRAAHEAEGGRAGALVALREPAHRMHCQPAPVRGCAGRKFLTFIICSGQGGQDGDPESCRRRISS